MALVEVAVGLPVKGTYHYAVPPELGGAAQVGARVLVPFGGRGVTGVIVRQGTSPPGGTEVRTLSEILDEVPALDHALIDLCLWVADYYEAPPGEVLRAALPAGTAVAMAGKPRLSAAGQAALAGASAGAVPGRIKQALARLAAGRPPRGRSLAALVAAGWVEIEREVRPARVKVRTEWVYGPARPRSEAEERALGRAPRRRAILAALEAAAEPVTHADLRARVPGAAGALKALVAAGLVSATRREVVRDPWQLPARPEGVPLAPTEGQARALVELRGALAEGGFQPFLLHGVTGSGKTEVYLRIIADVLAGGRGAIVLVPEIALTPQLAARFRARFGDEVAVLHSGLSDGERFDQWRRLRAGRARIALGARSAVFAPVAALGIVVVDEEHDPSFKQEEGVRYHARDVALVRAQKAGAICLLGSATPSLETFARAGAGEGPVRVRLLELPARATSKPLPAVEIVDLRQFQPDGEAMLTAPLRAALESTLAAGEQAILFLNRRGFATFVLCVGCGHPFRCPQCSVSLTYHRSGERLRCHYCGHAEPVPFTCPACGGAETIRRLGLGTERIEHALRERYPRARIGRLDRDTAAGRGLRDVLDRVAAREIDILVGTQMVTKGHDFPGVTLVGVLCADTGLSLPDFRAAERTFQLLTQVAGRAGRGDRPGRVIVQTWSPRHPAVVCARDHDYHAFAQTELAARRELGYPPLGRLVAVRIDGPDEDEVRALAGQLAARVEGLGGRGTIAVLGPSEAPLRRLKGRSRWHLWVKAADRAPLRRAVRQLVDGLSPPRGIRVTVDVDPVSAL